jgi:hypothetical protein
MEETRNAHEVSIGKPEEKRPLGRPKSRWEDITLSWRVLVNTVMELRVP